MMKKGLASFLVFVMLLSTSSAGAIPVSAAMLGTTGDCAWELDDFGNLNIYGQGEMSGYAPNVGPWGKNVRSVSIGRGVINIGAFAFSGCEQLSKVSIPNSVTDIGWRSFFKCSSITSLDIPESVTSIGQEAFTACTSLKIVKIKKGISSIALGAFNSCSQLSAINLPDSITSIGGSVFRGCTSLRTVAIPDSLDEIPTSAFFGCTALTSITISQSVTTIANWAFYDCISLTDVYYTGTEEEWKAIKISGNNRCLTNATIHYNCPPPADITNGEHMVKVVDSSGIPIANAMIQVTRSGIGTVNTYYTAEEGYVKVDIASVGNVDFTITADGYEVYTTVGKNFELDESGLDIIILYTPEEAVLKLVEATYQNTDAFYNKVLGIDVNLIKGTKRLSFLNSGKGYFRILCRVTDTSRIDRYVLYQDGNVIDISNNGVFKLRIAMFSAGKGIYVTTFGNDGTFVSTPLNLEICDDETAKSVELSFGDKITFTVPESVPFVGGSKIEYDIPILPLEFAVEDGKVYAGLNIKWKTNDDGDLERQTYKQQYEKLKTLMDDVDKLSKYKVGSHLKSNIDQFLKKRDEFKLPVAGKVEVTIFGGGEMTWSETGIDGMKLQAYLLIDSSLEKYWQTYYIVPITVNIEVGIEGKVSAVLDWDFDTNTVNADFELNVKPYLNAFGGAGVGKYVGVGAYGEAEVDMELQLFGTTTSPGVNYVDITGELGLKVYVGPLTYSKPFAYNTWHIYTRTDALRRATNPRLYYSDVFDSEHYSVDDVSYLSAQSAWLGDKQSGSRVPSVQNGGIAIYPLIKNAYRNMQPIVAAADDTIMVYVGADTDRDAQNITAAMYSVYNPQTKTWSEPIQVDSNLTADATPMVYSDGETIRLVYQDASAVYGNEFSQEEYLSTQNIVVYVYDGSANTFVHEQTFEANGKQYRAPQLTQVNGTPALVWIESEDGDLFGQGDNNKFMCSYYRDGAWSEPSVFADGLCTIADYTVGEVDGELNVLYVADADNDLGTDEDRSLILKSAEDSKVISDGSASQLMFVRLPSSDEESFAWISNEFLYALDTNGEAKQICCVGSPESVTVVGNKILFTAADDGGSEVYAVVYDGATDTYSAAVQVSEQDKYIERLSGVNFNGTELLVMTRKTVTIAENNVTDDCEFAWAVLNDQADLKIESVEYDYADIEDGEISLYLSVSNQGAAAVDEYTVSVKDADYNLVAEQTFNEAFLAGETKDMVVMMPLEKVTQMADYTVTIGNSATEESDTQTMTIGYADLAVSAESIKVGNQNTLVCTVTNRGLTAGTGQLLIHDGAEDNLVSIANVDSLAPGESQTYVVDLTSETTERVLTCAVKTDAIDYSEANNTEKVYFDFSVFEETECRHVYDDDQDADCNACGATREVFTSIPGDANGDGKVNNRDLGLLQQYLSGWDVGIDTDACDVNGDGRVNNRDLGLLQQCLAGWDVELLVSRRTYIT